MLQTHEIEYQANATTCKGYYAYDDGHTNKKPGILIVHDWTGRTDFVANKANQLAELGYVGFAVDMYGDGKTGNTKEEKTALMSPLIENRQLLLERITAALHTLKQIEQVDCSRIAAIGFCFGGLCVLDLARSGSDIRGAVSFHGALGSPGNTATKPILAKILALHGYDDPLVPKDQVIQFQKEMTEAKADWQFHTYGGAMHSFTNPLANDPAFGTVYNANADKRSWIEMNSFFTEMFN